ncbi:MAG TPA: ATP-binding protein [Cyclobacteriaceae bacterium]
MVKKKSDRQDQSVFEGKIIYDAKGKILSANSIAAKITGYKGNILCGKRVSTLVHRDDRKEFQLHSDQILRKYGSATRFTARLCDRKGLQVHVGMQLKNELHRSADSGIVLRFIKLDAGSHPVPGVRAAATIQDTLVEGIFSGSLSGALRYSNRPFLNLLGYRSVKQIAHLQDLFISPTDYRKITGMLKTYGELRDVKIQMQKKNKDKVWVKLNLFLDAGKNAGTCSGVVLGLHELQADKPDKLTGQQNSTLRVVLESAKDQILALDSRKRYIMFNQAHAEAIRGLTGKEIKAGDRFLDVLPHDLVPVARRELKRAYAGGRHLSEIPLPNKTILKASFHAIRDEKNKMAGIAIFAEDISERKKTELKLKAVNEELTAQNWQLAMREEDLKMAMDQLSERNFELDQLMYKTSHDLRSPLSSILGLVNLANLDPDPTNLGQYLKKIEDRIKKLDEFISSMVNYARVNRGEITVREIDLEQLVMAMIHELEYLDNFTLVKTIVVVNHGDVPFRNDHFLLKIIIGNVVSNAYKYYNPEVDSYLRVVIDVNSECATMEFSDNGIGIRKEHQDKIFDMFYRATDRSQGSGLGMYIVRQAIEKIDGTISLHSTYGTGTCIRIVVPNL